MTALVLCRQAIPPDGSTYQIVGQVACNLTLACVGQSHPAPHEANSTSLSLGSFERDVCENRRQ